MDDRGNERQISGTQTAKSNIYLIPYYLKLPTDDHHCHNGRGGRRDGENKGKKVKHNNNIHPASNYLCLTTNCLFNYLTTTVLENWQVS